MAIFKLNPFTQKLDMVSGSSADGDVVGPASSTDNAVARWDGTTGKLLQNSSLFINDDGSFNWQNGSTAFFSGSNAGFLTNYNTDAAATAFVRETSTTNAAVGCLRLICQTSGTAASGLGARLSFINETTTDGTNNDAAYIQATWTAAPTAGAATSRLSFFASSAGSLSECFRCNPSGNTSLVNLTLSQGFIIARATSAGSPNISNVQYLMAITSTAAPRTVTLPTGGSVITNQVFIIKDESGGAATNNITVTAGGAINIDGATTHVINTNYGYVKVYWNGTQYYKIGSA